MYYTVTIQRQTPLNLQLLTGKICYVSAIKIIPIVTFTLMQLMVSKQLQYIPQVMQQVHR